jgi:hypothetical protein
MLDLHMRMRRYCLECCCFVMMLPFEVRLYLGEGHARERPK